MVTKTTEIELKIDLPAHALGRMKSLVLPKGYSATKPVSQVLRSIYFDTDGQALKQAKWSLRVRKSGRDWIQTVKSGTGVVGGLSKPREYETKVAGPALELGKIEDRDLLDGLVALTDGQKLAPQFETVIHRDLSNISDGNGCNIELALDAGEIVTDKLSAPIGEMELELKAGEASQLFQVAKSLLEGAPVRFSSQSKAQRGYALAAGEPVAGVVPRPAGATEIAGKDETGEAFRVILRSCLDQIAHNRIATLESDDPEGPHQLRIGLRRLRTAFAIFGPHLSGEEATRLGALAQEIAVDVGHLRDLDVLIGEIVSPLSEVMPAHVEAEALIAHIDARRARQRKEVRSRLSAAWVNDFLMDLGAFAEGDDWCGKPGEASVRLFASPAGRFAGKALERRWRKVAAYGKRIETLTVEERHAMRKAMKKLRYTVEFFRSLYPKKRVKPFLDRLRALQDMFGYLNDVAMAEKLTDLPPAQKGAREISLGMGFVIGWHEARSRQAWEEARKIWNRARKAEKFWA